MPLNILVLPKLEKKCMTYFSVVEVIIYGSANVEIGYTIRRLFFWYTSPLYS